MRLAVLVAAFVMSAMGSTLRADYYEDYCDYTDAHSVKETFTVTPLMSGFASLSLPRKFKICVELIDWNNDLNGRSVTVNIGGLGSVMVNRNYPTFKTHDGVMPGYNDYHLPLYVDWDEYLNEDKLHTSSAEVRVTFFYQPWW